MRRVRVIPLLMIDCGRAVISRRFGKRTYVGDPINAIKIFNEKEVDELIILDISSFRQNSPDYRLIEKMASESFMPLAYGGHIKTVDAADRIIQSGMEKISVNTALHFHPEVVRQISTRYGKQSVVASIDVKRGWFGKTVMRTRNNTRQVSGSIEAKIAHILSLGVGEILLNCIDRDGCLIGYDLPLINRVSKLVNVPLIACGGASSVDDFRAAIQHGASAVAAGAMFYFKGSSDAVLINYPSQQVLLTQLYDFLG